MKQCFKLYRCVHNCLADRHLPQAAEQAAEVGKMIIQRRRSIDRQLYTSVSYAQDRHARLGRQQMPGTHETPTKAVADPEP
jgi:hypothetical protein